MLIVVILGITRLRPKQPPVQPAFLVAGRNRRVRDRGVVRRMFEARGTNCTQLDFMSASRTRNSLSRHFDRMFHMLIAEETT